MDRQKLLYPILLLLFLLAVCLWIFPGRKPDALPPEERPDTNVSVVPEEQENPPDVDTPLPETPPVEQGQNSEKQPDAEEGQSLEDVERFLRVKGRSARNLLQAYYVADDRRFLEEALQTFPTDPRVLLEWAVQTPDGGEKRKEVLLAFGDLRPEDAMGFYLLGDQLLREGEHDASLDLLMEGSRKPFSNGYRDQRIEDAVSYYQFAGLSLPEAQEMAFRQQDWREVRTIFHTMTVMKVAYDDILTVHQDPDMANVWALAAIRTAQNMATQSDKFLMEQIISRANERRFLNLLPPDTELEIGGMTVQERLVQLNTYDSLINLTESEVEAYQRMSPLLKEGYYDRVMTKGELEAMIWLKQQLRGK